ncbi:MAG: gamma-butyrobetaine dioxygenase [Arenicella sp.]|jgi:gamma-butyrobetaine dioxygenase
MLGWWSFMVTLNTFSLSLNLARLKLGKLGLNNTSNAEFHYPWLRDNCQCAECSHPDTNERILVSSEIPFSIRADKAEVDGEWLKIDWNHRGHKSVYRLVWLAEHNYSQNQFIADPAAGQMITWGAELQANIPTFQYAELYADSKQLLSFCQAVRDYGLCIVRNAPTVEAEIERFAEFIACVRETIYDRLHNVRASPGDYNAYNVASTTLELKPHTDMPNYNNPPGVQMFHFLVNDSIGGESTAVDGARVAEQLKNQDPEAYDLLAKTPVCFRMFSARGDVINTNPLLTLDVAGRLRVFRFSNQLAQPVNLPADKVEAFYRAYRKLGKLVEAAENKVQFRLNTGDIMVTNNLRVMHGRNAYDPSTGDRHLQLSYMDYDDVLSRIRMLLKA